MLITLTFLLVFINSLSHVTSYKFNNPVLQKLEEPGVIKVKNTYYMVSSEDDTTRNRIPIYSSPDLETWKFETYVFTGKTYPTWVSSNSRKLFFPKIHYVNGLYNVYYEGNYGGYYSIGVASALTPTGPYKDIGHMQLYDPTATHLIYPTVTFSGK